MNFYKRYPGDYRKKTARLTLAQHGAYTLLLDELYLMEAGLPARLEDLCRICAAMTPEEQEAVRVVVDMFFPVGADGLRHNERAAEEIVEARPAIEAARNNGKKGGRPPKKPKQEPNQNPLGFQEQTQQEPSAKAPHSPDTPTTPDGAVGGALHGVPDQVLQDYLKVRKAKRAGPLTDTAVDGLRREGAKAGLDLAETIRACAEYGWQGFNAGWYANRQGATGRGPAANDPRHQSIHDRRAATSAALRNPGDNFDDERTFDAESRIVG